MAFAAGQGLAFGPATHHALEDERVGNLQQRAGFGRGGVLQRGVEQVDVDHLADGTQLFGGVQHLDVVATRNGPTMKIRKAQNRLESTLQAAKNATAPTVAKPVKAVQSTEAETPRRSSTSSSALRMMSQRTTTVTGVVSSCGNS
ncbi:hypothetical protein SDC9_119974 [bioreactor metagenome]|uniref:Uncharacterized protein n=1 Tax=bioreactor metagenome TaxID=1076179 RepID=A0A645C6K0_9ZZZZ